MRLAHGLTEFLLDYARRSPSRRLAVSFENADHADPLDRELLAVLLRRADPARLTVRVGSSCDELGDPLLSALKAYATKTELQPVGSRWAGEWMVLADLSRFLDVPAVPPPAAGLAEFINEALERMPALARCSLANDYVKSDCTSDCLLGKLAYAGLPEAHRRQLHLTRAAQLENHRSRRLGALPLHYEQAGGAPEPLLAASKRCMDLAYYEAALDWASRGRRMLAAEDQGMTYCQFTHDILFSFLKLGRLREVEAVCEENLARSQDPALLTHTSYAKAMLFARWYEPSRRDYAAARAWVERSIQFAEMLPPADSRAVTLAFLRNTMALVELRTGHSEVACQLLCEALDYMAKEAPERYNAESVILLHNRARLYIARHQNDQAIEDLTTLVRQRPCESEAYLDRGLLHHRAGRYKEALRDYDAAIRSSPPYPEPYFNLAHTLVQLGRKKSALRAYDYVLVLSPGHVEALNNRAYLLYERGDFDAARGDVEAALRLRPAHPRLLCLHGLLEMKAGRSDPAYEAFTKAIKADPSLPDAWINLATVLFKRGELEAALRNLTQALRLREDAPAFYNRGRILEAQGKWDEAADDYTRALHLTRGGKLRILQRLKYCQSAAGSGRLQRDLSD
ncbi:MAG TPA: tetratricopeptide repeat protein [Terriglobia bacterium]